MTIEEIFKLCDGKENWAKLYSSLSKHITDFVVENNLDHSEHSFDVLKTITTEVIDDIEETWYRQSLGKR